MFARGALRGTRRRQAALSQAAEHRDRIELGLQGTLPGVRPEAVVVAPVARQRDLLCQAGRDDQTHVGGDGGPRDLQRSRQVIERKGAIRDHQEAEKAAADARQSEAPEVDTHTLDELLQRGRETFSFRHVALLLDAYCPSALRQVSRFARATSSRPRGWRASSGAYADCPRIPLLMLARLDVSVKTKQSKCLRPTLDLSPAQRGESQRARIPRHWRWERSTKRSAPLQRRRGALSCFERR